MLIFGDYKCTPPIDTTQVLSKGGIAVYNFSSYVQNCPQLTDLLPKAGVDYSTEENFDMSYFDYIFNNNDAFIALMTIMMKLYEGYVVYLIINHTDLYDKLAESLAEIIKQRYGYGAFFINDTGDYEWVFHNLTYGDFSIPGLANLDIDKKRMMTIMYNLGILKEEDYD